MTLVKIIIMIMAIETGGEIDKNNAVGDGGKAIGCLQIHPITVDEANRILDRQEFTLADRRSKAQSFRIASTVLSWRIRRYRLRYGRDPSQYDVMPTPTDEAFEGWQAEGHIQTTGLGWIQVAIG